MTQTSPAFDVATRLQQLSYGTVGSDIGVNAFMDKADNEIAVFSFTGEPELVTHGGKTQIEYIAIQVQVRNKNQQSAESQCLEIYNALRGSMALTLNTQFYDFFKAKRMPAKLSLDEQLRTIWYCELQVERKPA